VEGVIKHVVAITNGSNCSNSQCRPVDSAEIGGALVIGVRGAMARDGKFRSASNMQSEFSFTTVNLPEW